MFARSLLKNCQKIGTLRRFSNKEVVIDRNIKESISNLKEPIETLEEELEEMFVPGPTLGQIEWGGPTRGGRRPEPTRYGDWERKGRISDF